jgi:hypothetical protein
LLRLSSQGPAHAGLKEAARRPRAMIMDVFTWVAFFLEVAAAVFPATV